MKHSNLKPDPRQTSLQLWIERSAGGTDAIVSLLVDQIKDSLLHPTTIQKTTLSVKDGSTLLHVNADSAEPIGGYIAVPGEPSELGNPIVKRKINYKIYQHGGPNRQVAARGRASQTRRANARKDAVRASGDEEAIRRFAVAEKYTDDGFRTHGKKINKAKEQYREQHGKCSVTPAIEARIQARLGTAPTKLLKNRARIIIRDDLPMLASKPNFKWAADTKTRKRADLESNVGGHKANLEFIAAALLDVKAARKGPA
ncbi:hypothetical protein KCU64_g11719, partial [Aureobasidium melanogenum]